MTDQELLGAFEHLMRTQPPQDTLRREIPETFQWLGQAVALISAWDRIQGVTAQFTVQELHGTNGLLSRAAYPKLMMLIYQAMSDLRMKTIGPVNVALGSGMVFKYFEVVTQLIGSAASEVFFVDPYVDAEFATQYLPQIRQGVAIRILTGTKQGQLNSLRPAVALFNTQQSAAVAVRSSVGLHDRYVFIDENAGYQSGASFKDGAVNAPTTLTQITDAFAAVKGTYETMWAAATPI